MAKGEKKLTKLKSALKKMTSFKLGRPSAAANSTSSSSSSDDESSFNNYSCKSLHPVYVGKSRRRYLVGPDVVDHPLFRELVERSAAGDSEDSVTVGCEVVLFDHLLWMLENGGPHSESLDELADFYAS